MTLRLHRPAPGRGPRRPGGRSRPRCPRRTGSRPAAHEQVGLAPGPATSGSEHRGTEFTGQYPHRSVTTGTHSPATPSRTPISAAGHHPVIGPAVRGARKPSSRRSVHGPGRIPTLARTPVRGLIRPASSPWNSLSNARAMPIPSSVISTPSYASAGGNGRPASR